VKDEALALAKDITDPTRRLNMLREYLQALVLRSLHESEAFSGMAFVGGTALRFLEGLPRFSEDLDFSLTEHARYDPHRWLRKVRRDLELDGYDCSVTLNTRKTVHVAWVRVAALLREVGLAGRAAQKLAIKLEIDSNPPAGAETLATVLTRHVTFVVRHHELGSLMAGKLHALLTRSYGKGRDWFDLVWYRSRRPAVEPNLVLLQNALDQTFESQPRVDARRWKELVRSRLDELDVAALARDVRPFLERAADRELLTRETFEASLR
jgi:predicted nucleotidyltransferase component of viral defense system